MNANLPTTYDQKMAEAAQRYAKREVVSGDYISLRGGLISVDGYNPPGNQLCVVVLDSATERSFFKDRFDDSNMTPPNCYAVAYDDSDLSPEMPDHSWFQRQADACASCWANEWGSGQGKGKACKERRRLLLLPAGQFTPAGKGDFDLEVFEDPDHFSNAKPYIMKTPVTSTRSWSEYVQQIAALQRPPLGVYTRIFLENDAKNQFRVCFEMIDTIDDNAILDVLFKRNEQAQSTLLRGYEPPKERSSENAPRSGFGRG
jgi:hypothetical protein